MNEQLLALADPSRWRMVELLAEEPRSVGVVAELCSLRQPQATKHLQTLERAGLAVSRRSGNRRIYTVEIDALRMLAGELGRLVEVATAHGENRERFDQYASAVESETRLADRDRWADGRAYAFRRVLAADRATTWRHLVDPALLARWWTTRDLRLRRIEFGTAPGDEIVQEYADAADSRDSGAAIGRAEGRIDEVVDEDRILFRLSPVLADGSVAFTAHYEWRLSDAADGTVLDVVLRISDSKVPAAEFVAGIRLGWDQSLDNLSALLAATTSTPNTETPRESS
jgi:uncharacterized protein YndB with AHSA1/START domain/DNA-binding transcriptional ArsR family regulator